MDNMKNDYVKKIQKTQEAKSLLKHAYTIMQENLTENTYGKVTDNDKADIKRFWGQYKDMMDYDNLTYDSALNLTKNMLLYNHVDFDDLEQRYWDNANASNDRDIQQNAIDDLYSITAKEAWQNAMSGEWTSAGNKYLSDAQRDIIMLREEMGTDYDNQVPDGYDGPEF